MPESLNQIIESRGELSHLGANKPLWLQQSEAAWFIASGFVDVFIVPCRDGQVAGVRRHLFRLESGQLMLGIHPRYLEGDNGFLAIGSSETKVVRLSREDLRSVVTHHPDATVELARLMDQWVSNWYHALVDEQTPRHSRSLSGDASLTLKAGDAAHADEEVCWIRLDQGSLRLSGRDAAVVQGGELWCPLGPHAWFAADNDGTVTVSRTKSVLSEAVFWRSMDDFYRIASVWLNWKLHQARNDEGTRFQQREQAQSETVAGAITSLASLLHTGASAEETVPGGRNLLLAACRVVGDHLGLTFRAPPASERDDPYRDALSQISTASRVRFRRVVLSGSWWTRDGGPLVALLNEDDQPVALVPDGKCHFDLVNPKDQSRRRITAETARQLKPVAFAFYRPFPERVLNLLDIIKFGLFQSTPDLLLILVMGLMGGMLAVLPPIATGLIFDTIIPSANKTQLLQMTLGLMTATFGIVLFRLTRSVALLRVETKSDGFLQSAVWDRLLSLPPPFFRKYTTGDLANRANGVTNIRQILSGVTMNSLLSGIFSIFSFILLFYYSVQLALVATGLVFLNLIIVTIVSIYNLRLQRPLHELEGKISGMVVQLLTGIAKLRVAGKERHAFSVWANQFTEQKKLDLRVGNLFNRLEMFHSAFPIFTSMVLFSAMAFWMGTSLSTGQFLAFNAAFGGFLGAMITLSATLTSILDIVPVYERAKPILDTLPEVDEGRTDPGELNGRLEVNHIHFAYDPDGPEILKDVTFQVNPGEFVAIVGSSGSGKSTLFRILLGFETPTSGAVYYDRNDLAGLDLNAVRRQFGVVLQQSTIIPGSILENIVGSSLLTVNDAWEAAEKAGLKEAIEAMPMGMHTFLSEGAATFSGGQRQRLIIARAIVSRPRILLFDEATSALDNRTQAIVSESLERMQSTRIVIAHRLSTIINADRILVLQNGKLVQEGTYRELLEKEGPFAELAKRQMA